LALRIDYLLFRCPGSLVNKGFQGSDFLSGVNVLILVHFKSAAVA